MIQRKQTLFLLQSIFLSVALLFIPSVSVVSGGQTYKLTMSAFEATNLHSTAGHSAAIALNFLNLVLVSLIIFIYKKRELQVKLSYVSMLLWLVLGSMLVFCPFAEGSIIESSQVHALGPITCVAAIVALYFAQRFIKKDIALLKSADRIR